MNVISDMIDIDMNLVLIIISFFFLISFIVQIVYYIIYSKALSIKSEKNETDIAVSVIICARNEEDNLRKYLPEILKQDYSNYEVIVINDSSSDNSINVLAEYKAKFPHLNYTNIDEIEDFYHGKKLGVTIGVKAAKNEFLVLTDADCFPKSDKWLQSIVANFNNNVDLVLAYSGYVAKKGLLNKFIQYDTMFIAMQYLGLAAKGKPYMGVGRNMAYRKSTFIKNKGFASHSHILSGDDDLFVNEIANNKNTAISLDFDSQTLSEPKTNLKNWLNQKRRHLTTGKYYKFKHKIILGTEILSRFLFYSSFLLLVGFNYLTYYVLLVFFVRLVLQLVINKLYMNKLEIKKILLFSPILDIVIPLINLYLLFTNYITQRNIKWR